MEIGKVKQTHISGALNLDTYAVSIYFLDQKSWETLYSLWIIPKCIIFLLNKCLKKEWHFLDYLYILDRLYDPLLRTLHSTHESIGNFHGKSSGLYSSDQDGEVLSDLSE